MLKLSLDSKKIRIINLSLIPIIFFSVILLIRDIVNISFTKKGSQIMEPGDKEATIPPLEVKKDIMNYAPILEKNPFGSPQKLIPITKEIQGLGYSVSSAKPLTNLFLVGTVVGPKKLSYAIFEDRSESTEGKQDAFTYGKDVFGYGILTKIEKTWVELKQGVNNFKIPFVDIQTTEIKAQTSNTFIQRVGEKEYILNQMGVQKSLANPEQILTDARLLPNIKDGKQEGFKLLEVRPGGLYEALGLRNGDVLLRVNGLEISSPEIVVQTMTALKGMDRVNLDIIRDGSRMTMSYQIR